MKINKNFLINFKESMFANYKYSYFTDYEKMEMTLGNLELFNEKINKKIQEKYLKKLKKAVPFFVAMMNYEKFLKSQDEYFDFEKNIDEEFLNGIKKFIKKYTEVSNEKKTMV